MSINLPTYEQQQQAIILLQDLGLDIDTLLTGRVVKSVQKGVLTTESNENSIDVPISTVNPAKCFVVLNGSGNTTLASIPILSSLTSTNLEIYPTYTSSAAIVPNYRLSWQVIEFY